MNVLPVQRASFDHGGVIESNAISPNGQYVATIGGIKGRQGSMVRVWRADGTEVASLQQVDRDSAIFSNDSRLVAIGSRNGFVDVFALPDSRRIATVKGDANWITPLAFSPDGSYLVIAARSIFFFRSLSRQGHTSMATFTVTTTDY